MKRNNIFICLLLSVISLGAQTNLEYIYGNNDIEINNTFGDIFGNNFGNIVNRDPSRPYRIDIEKANNEIQKLHEEIASYRNENAGCVSEIEAIAKSIEVLVDSKREIEALQSHVTSVSAELYSVSLTISDREMRHKLLKSIEENRQQKYDLSNRVLELDRELDRNRHSLVVKRRFVTLNNLYIRKNNERIVFFNECISLSALENNSLDSVVGKSSTLQNKVDQLLSPPL